MLKLKKSLNELIRKQKLYFVNELMFRQDAETGDICLYTYEVKSLDGKVYVIETNVKEPENVIRWVGTPKPARPTRFFKTYLDEGISARYGQMYHTSEIFSKYVDKDYDKNALYSQGELIQLIDFINKKRVFEEKSHGESIGE